MSQYRSEVKKTISKLLFWIKIQGARMKEFSIFILFKNKLELAIKKKLKMRKYSLYNPTSLRSIGCFR